LDPRNDKFEPMKPFIFACFSKKMYNYHRKIMRAFFLFFCLATLAHSVPVQAQNYKLHPVFIFSFTRYIQWPEGYNTGDFEIKVLGESPIVAELEGMAKVKKAGDRTIKVTKVKSVGEIGNCNILFVPAAQSGSVAEVLQALGSKPTLIITEEPGMATKGGDINFITRDGKLAFELNQGTVNKKGLKVSTELTRLAILI